MHNKDTSNIDYCLTEARPLVFPLTHSQA